jgi:hypothetical protein
MLRNETFFSLLKRMLEARHVQVHVREPSVSMSRNELEAYSAVVVGVVPLTSMAANRAYGALSVIDQLCRSGKLILALDSPEPVKVLHALNAAHRHRNSLTKDFYSYRREFSQARTPEVQARLSKAVDFLLENTWPTTIYPRLPWSSTNLVARHLPLGSERRLHGVDVDAEYLGVLQANYDATVGSAESVTAPWSPWLATLTSSRWVGETANTINRTINPLYAKRMQTDAETIDAMRTSFGVIIPPHETATWWSTAYAQAMHLGVPVVTDWQAGSIIDPSWSVLASNVEDMRPNRRVALAEQQRSSYLGEQGSPDECRDLLLSIMNIKRGTPTMTQDKR